MSETSQTTDAETNAPPADLPARVEAALLTSDRALPAAKLAEVLGGVGAKAITDAIETLNADYEKTGRSFRIEQVAGGWKVMTLPEYSDVLEALHQKRSETKLSPAALETLAIIAYKQPVLRAEIEAIRGAASGEVIRSLMERHLIKIVGRAEEIGRPMLYGTTKTFLEVFGLSSLKDLPQVEQLKPDSA
ncbi:MAG: SMC-Scp complex subunit ScpB [Phycisphaeraceae bacterium]